MTQFSIGQAAQATGLTDDTLRYYERLGLMPEVSRANSGHRRYSEDDIRWLEFLLRLRGTGMSLEHIQTYVALWRQGDHTVSERKALLEAHAAGIETQMTELQVSLDVIHFKLEHYRDLEAGLAGGDDCPLTRPKRKVPKRS